ncbi:glucose-6-phosphate isomerase [Thermophagus xiamenensis]|uniref:Glucose-6-phosphate isomerase n=1 Tax=Thermophagus xiamenensis TaxID=385682 RepID=A0A1I1UPG7_9BACT|nr:glucose-6-phosphate isomerase [Thermophagus xiamenensis]SFD72686.1 glucose-6-phosphate isomerase [Thermophagus xiamenensis]
MKNLAIDVSNVAPEVSLDQINAEKENVQKHLETLMAKTGKGNDFLGWVDLPAEISADHLKSIEATAERLRNKADYVVVTGIGGSYLGARAVIDALNDSFDHLKGERKNPVILYAGHNISEDYTYELLELLKDKSFGIIVISKSGTTTEPAIAFRVLKELLETKYDKSEVKERIVAITDAKKGALRTLAEQEGYETFVIPDDVGGRYSVLTPVGLLPIAVAGFSISELVRGAKTMRDLTGTDVPFDKNPSSIYAATRNLLYQKGKKTEILVNYHPKLHYFAEWWKQLYGESEGKENKGIFPAAVDFTTDLHSMGQWIQEGERTIFETVISVGAARHRVLIPRDEANLDNLNYLAGKRIDEVNKMAELGTRIAHTDGGVPNIRIELPELNEYYLGQMIYFFEKACGISGYILGVNPFDQPGVEAYKKNMFALLGKPGFEKETEAIKKRL